MNAIIALLCAVDGDAIQFQRVGDVFLTEPFFAARDPQRVWFVTSVSHVTFIAHTIGHVKYSVAKLYLAVCA